MFEPSLRALGYRPSVEASFRRLSDSTLVPARVVTEHRAGYDVAFAEGVVPAELTGKLRHASTARDELPAVGDWVACRVRDRHALIHAVLPRSSVLRRGLAGGTTEAQLVAANVDVVFLVTALDRDLNPRRIERYLTALHASGAEVQIVLTKADLCEARVPPVEVALAAARGGGGRRHVERDRRGDRRSPRGVGRRSHRRLRRLVGRGKVVARERDPRGAGAGRRRRGRRRPRSPHDHRA